jgi:hypothetical protein
MTVCADVKATREMKLTSLNIEREAILRDVVCAEEITRRAEKTAQSSVLRELTLTVVDEVAPSTGFFGGEKRGRRVRYGWRAESSIEVSKQSTADRKLSVRPLRCYRTIKM